MPLELLRREDLDIPLILVTGALGEEKAVECIKQGATDYVLKDRLARLPVAVRRALHEKRLREENRQVETARAESESRLASIISSAMDGIITVGSQQRILLFNEAAQQMFRCSSAQAVGQSIDQFIPERFRAAHAMHIRQFVATGATKRVIGALGTMCGLRTDGEEFPIEAAISQVTVGGQKLFTVILRDITERKQAEQELAKKAEQLARSNAELEQFAYVASHDLQEPLRMVATYTQLLAERYRDKLDEQAHKYIHYAVDGAMRMQTLIQDLLAFSRAGRQGADLNSTDCNTAVEQALKNLQAAIQESGALVHCDDLPAVIANSSQLVQVFQNLIGNALKFRRAEAPTIQISTEKQADEWVFSVTDNGIGIAPEYCQDIFVIFKRLHTRTEYPGNGIGSAICRKIIELHGGRIWATSKEGHGSTFKFTLPAIKTRAAAGTI